MYEFVDTIESGGASALPAEAILINGECLDTVIIGFSTLATSGRESLSVIFDESTSDGRDGSLLKSRRIEPRDITVKYQIIAETAAAYRAAYTELTQKLNAGPLKIIFNDERDKYFVGYLKEIGAPTAGTNATTGEFVIRCLDPCRYSTTEKTQTFTAGSTVTIDYDGTYQARPVFDFTLNADARWKHIAVAKGDYSVAAGNVYGKTEDKDKTLVWDEGSALIGSDWKKNNAVFSESNIVQTGYMTEQSGKVYAGYTGSGSQVHGPSMTKVLSETAKDCRFRWHHYMTTGAITQNGVAEFGMIAEIDGVRTCVAQWKIYKSSTTDNKGGIQLILNGTVVKTIEMTSFAYDNEITGQSAGNNSIEKKGSRFVFIVGPNVYSFDDTSLTNVEISEVFYFFGNRGSAEYITVNEIDFVAVDKYDQVPFYPMTAVSKAGINCSSGDITTNGQVANYLGNVSNDWEDITLEPGTNEFVISAVNDSGLTATGTIKWRDVYL